MHGDGSNVTGVSTLTNAQVLAFIEQGFYGNLDISTNVSATNFTTSGQFIGDLNGDGSSITGLTTSIVSEGTNLYYTDSRFDTRLATKDTGDLTEGTNLYYTDARSRAAVSVTLASFRGAGTLT